MINKSVNTLCGAI